MSSPATLRAQSNGKASLASPSIVNKSSTKQHARTGFSFLDILRILGGLALFSTVLSYYLTGTYTWSAGESLWTNPYWLRWKLFGDIHLTPAQLAAFDGTYPGKPIYIALNGTIYDVSASPKYYGPGGGYHVFAGADATRAFVTGCFLEDRTDDLRGVEEVYMPLDLDEPPAERAGMSEEEKKEERRAWKNRKAQAKKIALEKVRSGIEGWKKTFEGTEDKYSGGKTKYFRVGTVRLTKEDIAARERKPKPALCSRAQKARPKSSAEMGIL